MNLGELKEEINLITQDSSLETYATTWINQAILELASDCSLPYLRLNEPVTLATTESDWIYDMPSGYHKNLFKCYDEDWNRVTIKRSLDDIDALNIEHDDTNSAVTHVAVRDLKIGIYPMAIDTLRLWYYEKPTTLTSDSDEPSCIPAAYHSAIVAKVIVKNFQLLMDMSTQAPHQSLMWWQQNLHSSLYGDGTNIGLINFIARGNRPKRRGGSDPLP